MKLMRFLKDNWLGAVFSGAVGAVISDVWGLAKLAAASVFVGINWNLWTQLKSNPAQAADFVSFLFGVFFTGLYFLLRRRQSKINVATLVFLNATVLGSFIVLVYVLLIADENTLITYIKGVRGSLALVAMVGIFVGLGELYASLFEKKSLDEVR
jgi:uncharacterized membrane protein